MAGSKAAADVATASVTSVRPQPRGMKMRYRPPGFGTSDPGQIGSGSESEEEEHRPVGAERTFQFPKELEASGTSKKNKDKGEKEHKEKKDKKSKRKEKA